MEKVVLNFQDEWEKGGKHGRKQLNDRRSVETSEGEIYLEFKVGNHIARCDTQDINLLNTYHWNVIITNRISYVRTSVRQGEQILKLYFARLALNISDGHVAYSNGNTLDNRRSNLSIRKALRNPKTDYIVEKADLETIKSSLDSERCSEWATGKPGGSLYKCKDKYWRVIFQSPCLEKCFFFTTYGGQVPAYQAAVKFRIPEAKKRDCVWNNYRIHYTPDNEQFLEVQAKYKNNTKSFFCDIDDLYLVYKYKWHIRKRSNSQTYEIGRSGGGRFHTEIGLYKVTDHIDGNPLNNRRCNLRDGKIYNPRNYPIRNDNQSGVTGVSFNKSKNLWVVQWPEGGKRKCKSFSIIECKRNYEEARGMAIKFRLSKNSDLNLHEQQILSQKSDI
uniref:AP2/ERF domain-containing protein n=1 Tax=Marseillevirus LCMAC102 TaxID=2506603 RepID=A0A481YT93_9VIRU|nr:MAG: uncharacterized protein LCMAC102_03080 [Marseillevirus LCMAC102]